MVTELLGRHGLALGRRRAAGRCTPAGAGSSRSWARCSTCPTAELAPSYDVLRDVGNCSSATVLLVLERVRATRGLAPGDPVVAMAFGPGLTLYAALLRQR